MRSTCIGIIVFVGGLCCGLTGPGIVTAEEGTLLHGSPTLTPGFSANPQVQLVRDPYYDEKHQRKHYESEKYDRSRRYERREVRSVVCKSKDYEYNYCPINRRGRNVRLVRQLSDTRCRRGDNWGTNRNGVWVHRGCSAKFVVE